MMASPSLASSGWSGPEFSSLFSEPQAAVVQPCPA